MTQQKGKQESMESEQPIELEIDVRLDRDDQNALDQAARRLLQQVQNNRRELNVVYARVKSAGPVPEGSRPLDPAMIGVLVVGLLPTFLTNFLTFLHDWMMSKQQQSLHLKIPLNNGQTLEVDVPRDMQPEEVERWITSLFQRMESLRKENKKHGTS